MKRIISAILVLAMLMCLGACKKPDPYESEEMQLYVAQDEVISSLGTTKEGKSIVAYEDNPDNVVYVVAKYQDNVKYEEYTYYFFASVSSFNKKCEEFSDNVNVVAEKDKQYLYLATNVFDSNDYATDLALAEKNYNVK